MGGGSSGYLPRENLHLRAVSPRANVPCAVLSLSALRFSRPRVSLSGRSLAVCWSVQVMLNGSCAVRLLYKQRARSMDDFSIVSSVVATVLPVIGGVQS